MGVLLFVTPAGIAEPQVVSLRMVAELVGETDLAVELWLELLPEKAHHLPLAVLILEGVTVTGVVALGDTAEVPLTLRAVTIRNTGSASLTADLELAPGVSRLSLRYLAEGAVQHDGEHIRLILPVLAPKWRPVESPDVFTVQLTLPSGTHLIEAFPTDLRAGPEGGTTLSGALPVVPSFLRVHAKTGSKPWITVARLVDAGTVVVLVVLLAIALSRVRDLAR